MSNKMERKRLVGVIIIFLLFTVACEDSLQRPEQLVPEDEYISLLVEMQLIRSYEDTGHIDSLYADSLRDKVFEEYGISADAFWDSHLYYQEFPKEQKERIDEAIERLQMDQVDDTTRTNRPKRRP